MSTHDHDNDKFYGSICMSRSVIPCRTNDIVQKFNTGCFMLSSMSLPSICCCHNSLIHIASHNTLLCLAEIKYHSLLKICSRSWLENVAWCIHRCGLSESMGEKLYTKSNINLFSIQLETKWNYNCFSFIFVLWNMLNRVFQPCFIIRQILWALAACEYQ